MREFMRQHAALARSFLVTILFATFILKPLYSQTAPSFDVAIIRPSSGQVPFERSGSTHFTYGTLTMRDVPLTACIQLAYSTQQPLVTGPSSINNPHYDIVAKTSPATTEQDMRLMLQTLLHERFALTFHMEKKELRVYTMVVAPHGIKSKLHPSVPGGDMHRENSAKSMVASSITMQELATYLSDPLGAPLLDRTGLTGPYDLSIDFTPYVDMEHTDVRPDPIAVLKATLKGDLGLDLVQQKEFVDTIVVDQVGPPTSN
jgi:uncharacterized protein (TIGR03435 family)